MDAVSDVLDDLAVDRLEVLVEFAGAQRECPEPRQRRRLVLFPVAPYLLGLQVVVEVAKHEQGAIEPLLLLGPWIETIFEGREHFRERRVLSYLIAHCVRTSSS